MPFCTPVNRQFNYLCCFSNNVLRFKDEANKLANAKNDLDDKVTHAKNNGKEIVSGVTGWLRDYSDMETKVGKIEANISNVQSGCLAIKSRYALSKKVKKATKDMKELRDGCRFDGISRSPPPPSMVPAPLGEANEFPSRKQIEEDVMQALRDKNVPMMGMCGMGGLGKTTMAKKVMHRVRDEQLFDEVLMVVVSKDIDKLNIQQQLAELLGLSLGVETLQARAHKLRARLRGNKRTLIVVDDIWSAFDLAELGIPCESGGTSNCTILLTSRSQNVFKKMNAVVFSMDVLSKEEAWSLFKSKVGEFVEEKNLEAIAKKVADECNGLPLALAILGSSLKDKTEIGIWEDALRQLKDSNLKIIPEFLETIYPSLRLSYEKLNDSNARRLFLFCSQFIEDYNRFPTDLTQLVHLRYIVLSSNFKLIPESLSSLWNIQTFVVETSSRILDIKGDIWKMIHLRHVKSNACTSLTGPLSKSKKSKDDALMIGSLQTLSTISPESCTEDVFARVPNLKVLGIRGQLSKLMESKSERMVFDGLGKLTHLENLKLLNDAFPRSPSDGKLFTFPSVYKFLLKYASVSAANN